MSFSNPTSVSISTESILLRHDSIDFCVVPNVLIGYSTRQPNKKYTQLRHTSVTWSREEWLPATRFGPGILLTGNRLNFDMEKTHKPE